MMTLKSEMSFLEHIQDLRKHVVRAVSWVFGTTLVFMCFMKGVVHFLKSPFYSYQLSAGTQEDLTTIDVFEVVMTNLKACLLMGLVTSVPFILKEIWQFVEPGLYDHEKKMAKPFLLGSLFLFYSGIAFGFYVIVPTFLSHTLLWAKDYARVMLTYENYFHALIIMVAIFGAIFELPVVLSLFGVAGLLKSSTLAENRRAVFLGSFILGAIVAPPDVFSLVVVSLPIYAMCEVSIVCLRRIEKNRLKYPVPSP